MSDRDCSETLERLVAAVSAVDLDIAPPASVDAAVRARLAVPRPARHQVLRPVPAVVLALAGVVAFCVSLTLVFAEAGRSDIGLPLAAGVTVFYLAVSAAATVPLLIHHVAPLGRGAREVRR